MKAAGGSGWDARRLSTGPVYPRLRRTMMASSRTRNPQTGHRRFLLRVGHLILAGQSCVGLPSSAGGFGLAPTRDRRGLRHLA
jgi:hypothetical protein